MCCFPFSTFGLWYAGVLKAKSKVSIMSPLVLSTHELLLFHMSSYWALPFVQIVFVLILPVHIYKNRGHCVSHPALLRTFMAPNTESVIDSFVVFSIFYLRFSYRRWSYVQRLKFLVLSFLILSTHASSEPRNALILHHSLLLRHPVLLDTVFTFNISITGVHAVPGTRWSSTLVPH